MAAGCTTTGSPSLTNVTFSANTATNSGGGYNNSSNPGVRNRILWGNSAASGAQIYNVSSTPVLSNSVVEGGDIGGTNIITDDPLLGSLGNYGGSTKLSRSCPGQQPLTPGTPLTVPPVATSAT